VELLVVQLQVMVVLELALIHLGALQLQQVRMFLEHVGTQVVAEVLAH
jgi:hypothetical protein